MRLPWQTTGIQEVPRPALHEELPIGVNVIGVIGLTAGARSKEEGYGADLGKLAQVGAAVGEEVFGAIVPIAFPRSAVVVDIEVVGVAQGDLPEHPAFGGPLVPEPEPFGVAVEAGSVDGGVIGCIPPSVLFLGVPVKIAIAVQGVAHENIVGRTRQVVRQT